MLPERITIKRRRDEEPVEALYVESKRVKASGFWRRLRDGSGGSVSSARASTQQGNGLGSSRGVHRDGAGVPFSAEGKGNGEAAETSVDQRPSFGSEKDKDGELASASGDQRPSSGSEGKDGATSNQLPSGSQKPKHRRFKLAAVSPSPSPKMSSESGIRKRRKPPKAVSAVFVETDGLSRSVSDKIGDPSDRKAAHDAASGGVNTKFHNSQSEESPATIPNRSEPTEDFSSIETLKLAAELQRYAFRETGDAPIPSGPMGNYPEHFSPSEISDHSQTQKEIRESGKSHAVAEGDYVYDTYLHYKSQSPVAMEGQSVTSLNDLLQELPPESVGVLLLADDDAITIDIPRQDDPDEEAFDIDDDDENAEGYYGNDYPDEEIDFDDEFNANAYQYRTTASDDEEFDVEESAYWSDDDANKQSPWQSGGRKGHQATALY